MTTRFLLPNRLCSPSPPLPAYPSHSSPPRTPAHLSSPLAVAPTSTSTEPAVVDPPLRLRAVAGRRMGIVIDVDEVADIGDRDRDLPVDVSFTRRLPPALTLGDGISALRRAAEDVKASPPAAGSGVIRFEVGGPQVCGKETYLSFDSPLTRAYGSVGMKYDKELLSIEEKTGSFYFFIPQVELNEFDGYSMLSSTMVWDDSVSHTFEDAVYLFESCFNQIWSSYDSSASIYYEGMVTSYIG